MKKKVILILLGLSFCQCEKTYSTVASFKDKEELIKPSQDCYYQNSNTDLGIGILLWNGDCDTVVKFYDDKMLNTVRYNLDFCNETNEVCPLFYKPDYGIMHFSVKSKSNIFYEVYINDTDIKYISLQSNFTFMSWQDFLVNNSTVIREMNKQELYIVKSFHGDFVTVEDESTLKQKEIRWRKDNKLLIEIMLLI